VEITVTGDARKGLNSLIILGAWSIWKHRNDCTFNERPCLAGAKGLSLLTARELRLNLRGHFFYSVKGD
jgi:hypothetical protein